MDLCALIAAALRSHISSKVRRRNSFACVIAIQDLSKSSPRRFCVSVGISIASAGFAGGLCVMGSTNTSHLPLQRAARPECAGLVEEVRRLR